MAGEQRADYHDRVRRAQAEMARQGVDALAIGVGADLIYLAGDPSHTSERLTLMVLPKGGEPATRVRRLAGARPGPASATEASPRPVPSDRHSTRAPGRLVNLRRLSRSRPA